MRNVYGRRIAQQVLPAIPVKVGRLDEYSVATQEQQVFRGEVEADRRHRRNTSNTGVLSRTRAILGALSLLFCAAASAQSIGVNKSFNPVQIQDRTPFNVSRLNVTVTNNVGGKTLTNLNLTDNLPAGVVIAPNPNVSNACGATVAATAGASSLTIHGGQVNFGDVCQFQVDVVSTTASIYTNTIPAGAPLANGEVVPQAASASLTVIRMDSNLPKATAKTFSPNALVSGQTAQMTITLRNDNILPLPHTNLRDNLPAGMTIASPANASTDCSGGSLNATPGASQLSLSGTTIPPGATCTVTAAVVGVASGASTVNLQNNINPGDLTSLNGDVTPPLSNAGTTTGTLAVTPVPTQLLTKAFSTGSPYVGQAFSMTWTLYNNTVTPWSNLAVSDLLPAGLQVYATAPAASTTCPGGAVTAPGGNAVQLSGASLAVGRSCTVTIKVVAPTGSNGQVLTNTIPANSMTSNGTPLTHSAASASVTLVAPGPGTGPGLSSVDKNYVQLIPESALDPAGALPAGHFPATVTGGLIDMTIRLNKSVPSGGVDVDLTPLHIDDDWSASAPNLRFVSTVSNQCGGTLTTPAGGQSLSLDNGVIAQGAGSCTIRVRLRADTNLGPPPLGTPQRNSATACVGNGVCLPAGSRTGTADGLVIGSPPLSPAKSFSPATIPLNGTSRASITIQNPASATRYNVQAVDALPPALKFAAPLNAAVSCTNNPGVTPTFQVNGKTLTLMAAHINGFSNSATPPQCTIAFDVVADSAASPGSTATNSILANGVTATDVGGVPDPTATNVRPADANLTFSDPLAGPQVSKGFSPIVVFKKNGNGPINNNVQGTGIGELSTLTLQIINPNPGGANNLSGLSLTDNLPAGVVLAPVPNASTVSCGGAAAVAATAGGTSVAISNATVTPGSSCVIKVDVVGSAQGNQVNQVPAGAVHTAQGVSNALPASATLTVLATTPIAALYKDVVKTGSAASIQGQPVAAGDSLTYVMKLSNPGYLNLSLKDDVKLVQDVIPVGATFVSATGGDFNGSLSGNKVVWDFAGSSRVLARGEAVTLMLNVKVSNTVNAPLVNVASTPNIANCGPYDSAACSFSPPAAACQLPADPLHPSAAELANPAICHPVVNPIASAASLKLVKSHSGKLTVGQVGVYTLTISNTGATASKDLIHISDLLPDGMSLIAANPIVSSNGSISNLAVKGQLVTFDFTPAAAITAGSSAVLTLSVNISAAASGNLTNFASISGRDDLVRLTPGVACNDANYCSKDPAVIDDVPLLSLTKTGPATLTLGGSAEYTLTVKNIGNAATSGALQLIEKLPPGLSLNGAISSKDGRVANLVSSGTVQGGLTLKFDFMPSAALPAASGAVSMTVPVQVAASMPVGAATNYASVGGGGDLQSSGVPMAPGSDCSDPHCASAASTIVAPNALLSVVKTVNKHEAELGDMLTYSVTVTNIGNSTVTQPSIVDRLPAGFRLIANSSRVSGATLVRLDGAPGPLLTYALDLINPGASVTLTYRVRLGVGAMQGDGINRVTATCPRNGNPNCANEARAKVHVVGGVFTTDACVVGMIFVDCNGNQVKDSEELGIPGVHLYLENGTYLISDVEGKYSFCGLSPKTHVLKVDQTTLPRGSRLVSSSNRNAGDAGSLFLDLKNGELQRADFIEGSCSNPVLEQVKARRAQGEITGPQTEKKRGAALKFEGKAPDYPQQGTDSANQTIVKPRIEHDVDISRDLRRIPETISERDTPLQQLEINQGGRHAQ
ncbi:hypothetical protein [Paraherbaspirillum soli]|uniref:DUF11 domain-containing protein n=1 Tax=Paraherbaspirillum soli TaxID=631222 RepID=A0ABW0M3A3_9BURK